MPVIVLLGERRMTVGQVRALAPGAIIELYKPVGDELHLMVNNRPIGSGHAVKVGENFGIKVNFVGDLKDRIQAMGGGTTAEKTPDAPEISLAEALLSG